MTPDHPLFVLTAWVLFMAPLVAAVMWLDATDKFGPDASERTEAENANTLWREN